MWQIVAPEKIDAQRLQNIVSVRWYFISVLIFLMILGNFKNGELPAFTSLFPICAVLITTNLWAIARLKDHATFHMKEIIFHLIIDSLCLFAILWLTGGSHNPFAILFLIMVILAAQCLPLNWAWGFSIFNCSLYLLLFLFDNLEHQGNQNHEFNLHLIGMIVSFVFLCFFITYYVAKTTHALNQKEKQIQESEKLLLIGAFAAQAAHQMGSPLSSLSVIAKQISDSIDQKYSLLLQSEIQRCQSILRELADKTAFKKASSGGKIDLLPFLDNAVENWSKNNNLNILFIKDCEIFHPKLILDKSFEYALYNLMDNAKEAGAKNITLTILCTATEVKLILKDDGRGFDKPPTEYYKGGTTYSLHGMGLGIYLTSMTVRSLNGELKIFNNDDRGATAEIVFTEFTTN